jgi:hypothetical protein
MLLISLFDRSIHNKRASNQRQQQKEKWDEIVVGTFYRAFEDVVER